MMRRRHPPVIGADGGAARDLQRRKFIGDGHANGAAGLQHAMRQVQQMRGIGNMFQHIAEMDCVETAQRCRAGIIEKSFGDSRVQRARMRRRLAGRFDAMR